MLNRRIQVILGVVAILVCSLFLTKGEVYAQHKMDILYNNGEVIPYEELKKYEASIPKETYPSDGTLGLKRGIIGEDNRENVTDVMGSPYRRVVRLHMKFPNGQRTQGSGAFISEATILTAGHCLYNSSYGGWATEVMVYVMGSDNYFKAQKFAVPREWVETNGPIDHDIGTIKLESSLGKKNGWFGLSQDVAGPITLTGFHGDESFQMKTETTNNIEKINSNYFSYLLDTFSGSSGSPVYNNNGQIIGVNGYMGAQSNTAINVKNDHYLLAHYTAFHSISVEGLEINATQIDMNIGEKKQISVSVFPENADNKEVEYSSSNSQVATVDHSGVITAISEGSTTIECVSKSNPAIKKQLVVNVNQSGTFGNVPWSYNRGTETLTFEGGTFPNTNRYFNISTEIEQKLTNNSIRKIHFTQQVTANSDSSYLFNELRALSSFENLKYLDTSQVSNMNNLFAFCSNIKELDLSNFNTANVKNMKRMFYAMSTLETLDLSSFDTSLVTDMSSMFSSANKLKYLDINGLDTHNVTDMSDMFSMMTSLIDLDLSSFNTSQVTTMAYMFSGSRNLEKINLKNFNTEKVTKFNAMFNGAKSLTNIDLKSFNTKKATDMSFMFSDCLLLESIDLSHFNTQYVTSMTSMFTRCSSLVNIDISNFNTSRVDRINHMFYGCLSLETLDVSNFDASRFNSTDYMFANCPSLKNLILWD